MSRRFLKGIATIVGLTVLAYIAVSLYLPSPRNLIFGINRDNGKVKVVRNGVTFLPPHEYYRLRFEKRNGSAQRDGIVMIESREKVPVKITYRIRFDVGPRLLDARRLASEGWSEWLRRRVSEAVSFVTSTVPIEEFASPQSQFASERKRLRATVANHLATAGLKVTGFEISKIDIDREALLAYKRLELRRNARGSFGKVAVIGIEGADWELLGELMYDGRIPNMRTMMQNGATGALQTIQPAIEPMLWATVETGVPPDRHGVIDFFDPQTKAPVDSRSRRAPAVWDIATSFGRSAAAVNTWTAWPPSDQYAVAVDTPVELVDQAVYPPSLQAKVRSVQIPANTIGYPQISRFLNITSTEFQKSVDAHSPDDPVLVFRDVLAKTWSDHRAGIETYRATNPLLFMIDFEGPDVVNHLFGPYHPPYREDVDRDGYRRYWPTVANYYAEIDRMIGEWMTVLTPDTTVIIVSTHGQRWGQNRPTAPPNNSSGIFAHRSPGVLIMYGPNIARSPARRVVSIFDLAPTLLSIIGLPQSSDMPGRPLTPFFRSLIPVTTVNVVSYGEFVAQSRPVVSASVDPVVYRRKLQLIGHLIDTTRAATPMLEDIEQPQAGGGVLPPQQWGAYAWYNNNGVELRSKGKTKEAIESFQAAIDRNPARPVPYLNMAMCLFDRQQFTAAEEVFATAVAKGLPNAERYYLDFAALYRQQNMPTRAIALLYKAKQVFPQSPLIAASLGSALASAERYTEAEVELNRALALQPTSIIALNNLGLLYEKRNDAARALDYWNRSLSIDPRQPQIQQAAVAMRTRL